jgi:hypothetical protein
MASLKGHPRPPRPQDGQHQEEYAGDEFDMLYKMRLLSKPRRRGAW